MSHTYLECLCYLVDEHQHYHQVGGMTYAREAKDRIAVEDTSCLYQDTKLVPPMAIAAYAMAALSQDISLPPGVIHVSQELEFISTVSVNDSLTSYAKVGRKQSRGKLHLLAISLDVLNQNQEAVLTGKTTFILPEQDNGE